MAQSISDVVEFVKNLTITQATQLVSALEEELGVSAQLVPPPPPDPDPVVVDENLEVVLTEVGERRLEVIRCLRAELGLSLREVRDQIASLPAALWEGSDRTRGEQLTRALAEAGAAVECRTAARS
ncbi:MAG: ribosomal protein L7/L12 [Myxococcales bacterium]|nr:ribosomal protein L7/L12 [Myxococcales bacterium]